MHKKKKQRKVSRRKEANRQSRSRSKKKIKIDWCKKARLLLETYKVMGKNKQIQKAVIIAEGGVSALNLFQIRQKCY
jgi:hypothetical protein